MADEHIYSEHHNGIYFLRLVGEIRFRLSGAMEVFMHLVKTDKQLKAIHIDGTLARLIDSTALGMIAQIALFSQKRLKKKPNFYGGHKDVVEIMKRLAFKDIMTFQSEEVIPQLPEGSQQEILVKNEPEKATSQRVLTAHKVLADLSRENRERFKEVIWRLEHDD